MPRRRRQPGPIIALASLLAIGVLTLFPAPKEVVRAASTPLSCILCGSLGGVDFLLNTLLYLPLGFGLLLAGFSWRRVLALAALLTFGVELLQMKVITGRDASLGDLIANTLGAGLGALLAARWRTLVIPDARLAGQLALAWAAGLAWLWAGTAWALGPALPHDAAWFGAWAPELANFEVFRGRPLMVTAGGEPLLPGRALDQAGFEDAVVARPEMEARAILADPPGELAPIGLIVDGRQRTVMLLGQDRSDLRFAIRLKATILRLRSPSLALPGGAAGAAGDTMVARGRLGTGSLELESSVQGRRHSRSIPLSASWGWTLVTPWDAVLGEGVYLLTGLWVGGLVAVLAYWSLLAGGAGLALIPVTVGVLLAAVPVAAGFPPAHWSEWVAAIIGTAIGLLAGTRARTSRGGAGGNEATA